MKVLVVDDEADVRRIARLALQKLGGMEVAEVADPAQAVACARRERPDAILLDVMMPTLDGPGVLSALRAEPETAAIPVIFLTGKALPGQPSALDRLGVAGVLAKPFQPLALARQVREILA